MSVTLNLVEQTTTTTGTGTLTLGAATQGMLTLASYQATAPDGTLVSYGIRTGAVGSEQFEVGIGTIGGSGTTLARTTLVASSTGVPGARLNLAGTSTVYVADLAADHLILTEAQIRDRANHTGTQLAGTISDFVGAVLFSNLTSVETPITDSAITGSDTVLTGFRKLIARILAYSTIARSWTAAQRGTPVALTPSGTITIDASLGNFYTLAPNANFGFANPTNLAAGQSFAVRIVQPASGGPRTITSYGSFWRFPGGIAAAPALSTAANAVDVMYCTAWSSTEIEIVGIRKDIKA